MEFFQWEQKFTALSVLKPALLRYVTLAMLDFLTKKSPILDLDGIHSRLEIESGELISKTKTKVACEGLQFLLHWMLTRNPQNTGKYTLETILNSHSALPETHIATINQAFSDYHIVRAALNKGEILRDSQWTLGVAVQTDLQNDLLQPYIRGSFTLVDGSSGRESRRVVEFTVPQFQEFLREMKRANSVLSSY